ncbi:MAG: FGGY family carbohydrate kinase [Chloroflexota bacterium]|nr:FGGY family carbohydrate kinase [Chloroflexota bacterium]
MRALIGVDIGTQGSKGALISESGHVLATHSIEQTMTIPRPGWAEHDADGVWWAGFVEIVRTLLLRSQVDPEQISGIGVSSLMPVMVPVDSDGRAVRPAISYTDSRAHAEMIAMNVELADVGETPLVGHDIGPKMIWFRDHEPVNWRRTRMFTGAQGHVIARLTGRYVIDSITASGMRPFFDFKTRDWDVLHCDRHDIPIAMLPEVVEMTDVIGAVTEEAAAETGLAAGTPVIGGATDFIAELISTGADQPGDVVVSYGTTLCLGVFSRQPIAPWPGGGSMLRAGSDLARLYPDLHAVGAGMATSGALTRWFRDQFGQGERRVEQELGINAYSLLALEAEATPPGADGLVVLPYFGGERTPIYDDQARGVIFGLTLSHGRAHIYRALLEGVAYGLQHNLDLIREAGASPRRIVATGGGSRSALWTQIVSDVTGLPQEVIAPSNAALGAAFLAGYARGIFRHIGDVRQWAQAEREVRPRDEVHSLYQRHYAVYRRLYERTKEEMHELAGLSDVALDAPPRSAVPSHATQAM